MIAYSANYIVNTMIGQTEELVPPKLNALFSEENIALWVEQFFSGLRAGAIGFLQKKPSEKKLIELLKKKAKNGYEELILEIDVTKKSEDLAQKILLGFKQEINKFLTNPPSEEESDSTPKILAEQFNSWYDTFYSNAKIDEKIENFLDSFTKKTEDKIQKSITRIQENTVNDSGKWIREVTLSALPWIALTAAVVTGVPLFILYIYHRAKHDMDREKIKCNSIKKKIPYHIPHIPHSGSPFL